MRIVEILGLIVALFTATGLLIASSVRDYRATGKVAWWWPSQIQIAIISRRFFDNYPEQRFSRKELKWVRRITWFAVILIILAILYMVIAIGLVPSDSDISLTVDIVVFPALIAIGAGICILVLRFFLWLNGFFGSDR